jgi:serine/threonine-protein kinase
LQARLHTGPVLCEDDGMNPRFRIVSPLAQGGFSVVSRAIDETTGTAVALKQARADAKGGREQLARETQTMRRLPAHRSVAGFVDAGEDWLAREWVEGETLDTRLERGVMSEVECAALLDELLDVLRFIHEAGFAHGDINESNVILISEGIKLIDFGNSVELDCTVSHTTGSVFHMAPELFDNAPATSATDLYAAGVLAYRAVSGRFPFEGETKVQVIAAHHRTQPPPLSNVSAEFNEKVMRLLERPRRSSL